MRKPIIRAYKDLPPHSETDRARATATDIRTAADTPTDTERERTTVSERESRLYAQLPVPLVPVWALALFCFIFLAFNGCSTLQAAWLKLANSSVCLEHSGTCSAQLELSAEPRRLRYTVNTTQGDTLSYRNGEAEAGSSLQNKDIWFVQ